MLLYGAEIWTKKYLNNFNTIAMTFWRGVSKEVKIIKIMNTGIRSRKKVKKPIVE